MGGGGFNKVWLRNVWWVPPWGQAFPRFGALAGPYHKGFQTLYACRREYPPYTALARAFDSVEITSFLPPLLSERAPPGCPWRSYPFHTIPLS